LLENQSKGDYSVTIENITIFAAFFAGLLSFISPCVLPYTYANQIVPAWLIGNL
jgi:cytochrome c biogenesis protein CcdA